MGGGSPGCSANVQQFLRGNSASSPDTNAAARRRVPPSEVAGDTAQQLIQRLLPAGGISAWTCGQPDEPRRLARILALVGESVEYCWNLSAYFRSREADLDWRSRRLRSRRCALRQAARAIEARLRAALHPPLRSGCASPRSSAPARPESRRRSPAGSHPATARESAAGARRRCGWARPSANVSIRSSISRRSRQAQSRPALPGIPCWPSRQGAPCR